LPGTLKTDIYINETFLPGKSKEITKNCIYNIIYCRNRKNMHLRKGNIFYSKEKKYILFSLEKQYVLLEGKHIFPAKKIYCLFQSRFKYIYNKYSDKYNVPW
jgi:hypothetical protein